MRRARGGHSRGGYVLAREAGEISANDVLEAAYALRYEFAIVHRV